MKKVLITLLLGVNSLCILAQNSNVEEIRTILNRIPSLPSGEPHEFRVQNDYTTSHNQVRHLILQQQVNGKDIRHALLQINILPNGTILNFHNHLLTNPENKIQNAGNQISAIEALRKACEFLEIPTKAEFKESGSTLVNEELFKAPVKIESVYEKKDEKLLEVWALTIEPKKSPEYLVIRVDKATGEIISKTDYTTNCHFNPVESKNVEELSPVQHSGTLAGAQYNVFPVGIEAPTFGSRQLLSNANNPDASPYGWHDTNGATGAEYTITRGNNVYAYEDSSNADQPGYSPEGGASLNFDFPLDFNLPVTSNMDASITNLFYFNNVCHDISWHYGFDEAGGNFQQVNYTGVGGDLDPVSAEGFDGSGTNNANFATPPDGNAPRMQMYLWTFALGNNLTINSPAGIAGAYSSATAGFGPGLSPIPITADLVLVNDGSGTPTLGCNTLINSAQLAGKIAVVERGTCTFVQKVQNAQDAGAIAVIVVNNQPGAPFSMGGTDPGTLTIPAVMISQDDGILIESQLPGVNGTLADPNGPTYFDCSFDNGIIAHEFAHGISNRLTGGPSNTDCLGNDEQMGEGWSDFWALVTTENSTNKTADRGIGTYPSGEATNDIGIRTWKYSQDMNVNPSTYSYIFTNNQVHYVGSVWCTMIWDMYRNLWSVHGYDSDIMNGTGGNNMATRLVFDGMKLQPCEPGFQDGRDAIILADSINNNGINKCILWKTFARRGLGYSASQGSSLDCSDGTEAFDLPPGCSWDQQADFTVSSSKICKGDTLRFTNLTFPVADSWSWSFPGGNPTTSSVKNPSVIYNQPGIYPVTLIAISANGSDTLTRTSFIEVSNGPDVIVSLASSNCTGPGTVISTTVSGGVGPYTYLWEGANTQSGPEYVSTACPDTVQLTVTDNQGCTNTQQIILTKTNGVENIANGNQPGMYPNPASSWCTITGIDPATILSIDVTDVKGRVLMTLGKGKTGFDTHPLAAGVYIVKIHTTKGLRSLKLVRE
jgi:hypothetical protein